MNDEDLIRLIRQAEQTRKPELRAKFAKQNLDSFWDRVLDKSGELRQPLTARSEIKSADYSIALDSSDAEEAIIDRHPKVQYRFERDDFDWEGPQVVGEGEEARLSIDWTAPGRLVVGYDGFLIAGEIELSLTWRAGSMGDDNNAAVAQTTSACHVITLERPDRTNALPGDELVLRRFWRSKDSPDTSATLIIDLP